MKKQEKKWLKRVFDYLTSDSYMFAPLISPPEGFAAAPGFCLYLPFFSFLFFFVSVWWVFGEFIEYFCGLVVEMDKPLKEDDRTLIEKVGDYLKSDNYMYAPLVIAQPKNVAATKAVKSPQTGTTILLLLFFIVNFLYCASLILSIW